MVRLIQLLTNRCDLRFPSGQFAFVTEVPGTMNLLVTQAVYPTSRGRQFLHQLISRNRFKLCRTVAEGAFQHDPRQACATQNHNRLRRNRPPRLVESSHHAADVRANIRRHRPALCPVTRATIPPESIAAAKTYVNEKRRAAARLLSASLSGALKLAWHFGQRIDCPSNFASSTTRQPQYGHSIGPCGGTGGCDVEVGLASPGWRLPRQSRVGKADDMTTDTCGSVVACSAHRRPADRWRREMKGPRQ